jgi:hypothetical protein
MANLAALDETGLDGSPQNFYKAQQWYAKAAAAGDSSLSRLYFYGKGVQRNDEKGRDWLKKSAALGSIRDSAAIRYVTINAQLFVSVHKSPFLEVLR